MSRILLLVAILSMAATTPSRASMSIGALFWDVCVTVFEVENDASPKTRNDLAALVSRAAQDRIRQVDHRKVLALPSCVKGNEPGFDRQLMFDLSIKRRKIKVEGSDWNLVVVNGVSGNGLFQDRDSLPSIILQPEAVSDDQTVDALVDVFDRSVGRAVRRLQELSPEQK